MNCLNKLVQTLVMLLLCFVYFYAISYYVSYIFMLLATAFLIKPLLFRVIKLEVFYEPIIIRLYYF